LENAQRGSNDHWVPQFYLRRWTDPNTKKLTAFRRVGRYELASECSTRSILSENHLYSVYGLDGSVAFHGESEVFKQIDHDAAEPMRWLADRDWKSMPTEEIEPLYRFIHTLKPRSRQMRDLFVEHDEVMQADLIGDLRRAGVPNAKEVVESFVGPTPKDRAVERMLTIARYDGSWREFFGNIPLRVYELGNIDAEFFTSDAPLASKPTIEHPEAVHVFPLSPKRCLVASHNAAAVERLCGMPPAIFASVTNLGTLSRAQTAIAPNERYRPDVFRFLGSSVNPRYVEESLHSVIEGKLLIGAAPGAPHEFQHTELDPSGYLSRTRAFCAGIDGAYWTKTDTWEPQRVIGPCEKLILGTRDWVLQASTYREAYELGRGLSYMFFQLDDWDQPVDQGILMRRVLMQHAVSYLREQRKAGLLPVYNLDVLLTEFAQTARDALGQIYYEPKNHSLEVWMYVRRGFIPLL
jgi:hypothetical protein